MEIVSSIISPVIESLMGPIKRHLGYLFSSADNHKNMTDSMKVLDGKRADAAKHRDRNERNTLEVPARIEGWLEDVDKIKRQAESISSNNIGCCNLIAKYRLGRKSLKTTLVIDRLCKEEIEWNNALKPLARVNTRMASAYEPSCGYIGYGSGSRGNTFTNALKYLDHRDNTQVIALCGIGGLGKTTMMEQLKRVVEADKMFEWVMKVDIGRNYTAASFLQAIEAHFSIPLSKEVEGTKVDRVRKMFEKISEKDRTLIILDDVWGKVGLKHVGLCPLPKGFKLLLTSRNTQTCQDIAIQAGLSCEVLEMDVLKEKEALELLCQFTKISEEYNPDLYVIGIDIVKKCSYLPLAIKLIAPTLIDPDIAQWRNARDSLKDYADIQEIVNKSYNYLEKKECKEILLLCGLFPEDSNIPIEDLTRYAWGLKLLDKVSKFGAARDRTVTRVSDLKKAHLLIDGDYHGYVKMHDVVLDFVLATIHDGDRASLVKHGDISELSDDETDKSYERMSLSSEGTWKFLEGIKCPNLLLLSLMTDSYEEITLPEGFYENMKNLEVMVLKNMDRTSVLRSLQCSINLRSLHLERCSLDDYSSIGNLSKLEVLSIYFYWVREFPSSFGNLKKLKVLDLNCYRRFCITNGVLKNFLKLEELYMGNVGFAEGNSTDLAVLSKNLSTLKISCYENEGQLNNMYYKNLKKFNIYVGKASDDDDNEDGRSNFWRNRLSLGINKAEFLKSRMNVLLQLTEVLFLQVDGMSNLEDIEGKSLPQCSSFCNLRILKVRKCVDLRYVFTLRVAMALPKLENLEISSCHSLEELIHSSGSQTIQFSNLKVLSLEDLPNLLRLCNTVNAIELPKLTGIRLDGLPNFTSIYPKKKFPSSSMEVNDTACRSFLHQEVLALKLETLYICNMEKLKDIWPCEYSTNKEADVHKEINKTPLLVGPWGNSNPLKEWHFKPEGKVSKLYIRHGDCIDAIGFDMEDEDGNLIHSKMFGGSGGGLAEINIEDDELDNISGTYGDFYGWQVVTSLSFSTKGRQEFGPYGIGGGIPFSVPISKGTTIAGFAGSAGRYLDAIAVYVKPALM